ncbi:ATP-dependent RNA helicase DHX33 isoform X2 [Latimeria chalumnae]|uniref:ATP-dependent RNA helicase DHX33 isoform X2 n=1 Tax=Latimeria chalumnae TaxID=7897 RepID=UPI0003C160FB|nr:PREDICTED: putative ATP-dependent RNA helicase DHX33 isoform X2 [Latimeria chalumnae]|eukprot:XP_005988626.1 PREDICTED: putative ATP-dependent RNA helicase DHX33 isoform X2 [Latimeria chalumnae]
MFRNFDSPPAKKFKPGSPLFLFTKKKSMLGPVKKGTVPIELQRRALPIYQARIQLINQLRQLESAIIIGETGSGKTTQIPQYLYEAGIGRQGVIAITQPRRVAAISLAARVSEEKKTDLGKLIGYTVRFEDVTSEESKIKFMTDGMLLREAIGDPLLRKYSIVILDEAHERTVHTDVLFGVVKTAQKKRKEQAKPPLKVIIMSATMDVDQFSQYFNKAPVLYLEGRQHPIQIFYTKQPQTDYLHAALVSVFQIHQEAPSSHDILVFLTGQEEIEAMTKTCRDIAKHLPDGCPPMVVIPLYASLPHSQQLRVFQGVAKGCRKVILSTNIAETSITISGIKYVIDTGMVKAKKFNPESGLEVLAVQRVSKAQAWQRTGRAGREDSGTCYRLYTEEEFEKFTNMTVPEIQRCNLTSVMLQLLALRIPDVLMFDFMSKPSPDAIRSAIDQLDLLGAVEQEDDQVTLAALGKKMAAFPLDPKFSKTILLSPEFHCTEEILTIVALLSVDSVLYNPPAKRDDVQSVRKKFISSEGDHMTLVNLYHAFKNAAGNKEWCRENFINNRNMGLVSEVRAQLRDICTKLKIPIESSRTDTGNIRRCLAHGLFMNAAELQVDGTYSTLDTHQPVAIHPSSVLFHCKPAYVLYNELLYTSKCYMRDLCVVDADWLYEAAPEYFRRKLKAVSN